MPYYAPYDDLKVEGKIVSAQRRIQGGRADFSESETQGRNEINQ